MQTITSVPAALFLIFLFLIACFLFWRHVWFFRNPARTVPNTGGIVSPADGTVVYVREVRADEPVIVIKKGLAATIHEMARDVVTSPKLVIGVFMSPFDVHYNRAPFSGTIEKIVRREPSGANRHMGSMHLRTVLRLFPLYRDSMHILTNERKVTRIRGNFYGKVLCCHVIQIAGKTVNGIDSLKSEGDWVDRGEIFGLIRIGSQVDLVVPRLPEMQIRVREGDTVRAGESILIESCAPESAEKER
ncbi:MAG: phosphatidylserine decarboxylase [Desulfomonilaceae bacterium]|nr:phosphatidylserine decarboxylase [Desulfomonilaceae bacterium]